MASVIFRRATQRVYVYYWNPKLNKTVQLSREETKHLDGKPKDEVYAWVAQWEKDNGLAKDKIQRMVLGSNDKLKRLWNNYQRTRKSLKKNRREKTEQEETELFERYICNFFIGKHQKKDPTQWHDLVPEFHDFLLDRKLSEDSIRKVLWTLKRFGKYLVFQRVMTFSYEIMTPVQENRKITPLKTRIEPADIIKFAKAHLNDEHEYRFSLIALIGYFAGLRPQELYALHKSDFLTGENTVKHCRTMAGFNKVGIGSKLSVIINKTLDGNKVVPLVKSHYSRGVVNIWDKEAARLIAQSLKALPEGRIINYSRGFLDRYWREKVKDEINSTVHDFRRASALYLGRTLRIPLTLLQEHMRHAEIETTMLYVREPDTPDQKITGDQDFDDVG